MGQANATEDGVFALMTVLADADKYKTRLAELVEARTKSEEARNAHIEEQKKLAQAVEDSRTAVGESQAKLVAHRAEMDKGLAELAAQRRQIKDQSADLTFRENTVEAKEKELSARENTVAAREEQIEPKLKDIAKQNFAIADMKADLSRRLAILKQATV